MSEPILMLLGFVGAAAFYGLLVLLIALVDRSRDAKFHESTGDIRQAFGDEVTGRLSLPPKLAKRQKTVNGQNTRPGGVLRR